MPQGVYYTGPFPGLKRFTLDYGGKAITQPVVIPRSEHNISRANISRGALNVLYRLKEAGYESYLVGGGVRDLLLGLQPKDFDIATAATPEEVKALFRNCRLIGRRFRLAHVRFGREIVEVATFRGRGSDDDEADASVDESGRILRDNVYGTLEEDAWRRDFSINGLYYGIEDFSIRDLVGGMPDLHDHALRMLGDPPTRYREDPVRMLRAVRIASKLGFRIHPDSERPLFEIGHLLRDVPPARLFDEVLKLFVAAKSVEAFEALRHYRLFEHLFPHTEAALRAAADETPLRFIRRALANTAARLVEDKPVTPAFLFAALLWEPVRRRAAELEQGDEGMTPAQALAVAIHEVTADQVSIIMIPKRFSVPMRDIWQLQHRFLQRRGKRALRFVTHPRFRAAYDFMLLRAEAGEVDSELAAWWTHLQETNEPERAALVETGGQRPGRQRRRRRRRSKAAVDSGE